MSLIIVYKLIETIKLFIHHMESSSCRGHPHISVAEPVTFGFVNMNPAAMTQVALSTPAKFSLRGHDFELLDDESEPENEGQAPQYSHHLFW